MNIYINIYIYLFIWYTMGMAHGLDYEYLEAQGTEYARFKQVVLALFSGDTRDANWTYQVLALKALLKAFGTPRLHSRGTWELPRVKGLNMDHVGPLLSGHPQKGPPIYRKCFLEGSSVKLLYANSKPL